MKRLCVLAPTCLCLGLLVGCGASFQEFNSADGQFKVLFPGKPKEQTQSAAGITMKMYAVEERNGAYTVGYGDMPVPENEPPAQIKNRLDGAIANMARLSGGTVLNQTDIQMDGKYPGRDFKIKITQPRAGLTRGKVFLKGKRFYQVFVMGTESVAESATATKFLDSFQLTK